MKVFKQKFLNKNFKPAHSIHVKTWYFLSLLCSQGLTGLILKLTLLLGVAGAAVLRLLSAGARGWGSSIILSTKNINKM